MFNGPQKIGVEVLHATKLGDAAYQISTRLGLSTAKVSGDYVTFNYAYAMSPDQEVTVEIPNQRYNSLDLTFGIHGRLKENLFF